MDLTPCEKAVDPTVRKRTQPLFVYTPDRCKTPGLLTRQMTPCAKLKIRLFGRTQLHIRSRLRRRPGARTQDIHYRGGEDAMIYQYLQNRIVSDRSIDEVNWETMFQRIHLFYFNYLLVIKCLFNSFIHLFIFWKNKEYHSLSLQKRIILAGAWSHPIKSEEIYDRFDLTPRLKSSPQIFKQWYLNTYNYKIVSHYYHMIKYIRILIFTYSYDLLFS